MYGYRTTIAKKSTACPFWGVFEKRRDRENRAPWLLQRCIILPGLLWFAYGLSGRDPRRFLLEGFAYFATFTVKKLVFYNFHKDLKKQLLFIKRHVEQLSSMESLSRIILKEGTITGAKSRQQTQHDVDTKFVGVKPLFLSLVPLML